MAEDKASWALGYGQILSKSHSINPEDREAKVDDTR